MILFKDPQLVTGVGVAKAHVEEPLRLPIRG